MDIDKADPPTHESMPIDERQELFELDHRSRRQRGEQGENILSIGQIAASQFADDKGVAQHLSIQQQTFENPAAHAKVGDPDGGVDEDHFSFPVFWQPAAGPFPFLPGGRVVLRFPGR